jgi:uncharacterized GH25 family protein
MKICRLACAAVALFSIAIITPATSTAANASETTIKIAVKNEHDKPVPNCEVILDFLGSRQVFKLGMHKKTHWEVHTNQDGLAHFPPVPEGTVQLQIVNSKYQTYGEKIELSGPEKMVEVTLHPPQSQYSAHPPLKPADAPKQ